MGRHIEGQDRRQSFLLPECVDDYVDENNSVRAYPDRHDGEGAHAADRARCLAARYGRR